MKIIPTLWTNEEEQVLNWYINLQENNPELFKKVRDYLLNKLKKGEIGKPEPIQGTTNQ